MFVAHILNTLDDTILSKKKILSVRNFANIIFMLGTN
jgi:hypothetical protein